MTDMLRIFKSLSDRTRLRIVRLLLERDLCVCELMFVLGMAQSRISHQLRILRDAGLVEDTREGQWIIYRVPAPVRATIEPLLGLFREDARDAGEGAEDRIKLNACLKEGIRRKKFLRAGSGPRQAGKGKSGAAKKPARKPREGEHNGH